MVIDYINEGNAPKAKSKGSPDQNSWLTVVPGTPLHDWVHDGSFRLLSQHQILEETRLLIEQLDSPGSVFRMNHASNYLDLRGTLNQDKPAMLAQVLRAEQNPSMLRPESWRGL